VTKILPKKHKWIGTGLGLVLASLFALIITYQIGQEQAATEYEADHWIAADISYITGVKTDDILTLKRSGKSWNEVFEIMKITHYTAWDF